MTKVKKLFGGINITWPKVILMAIITAVTTALLNVLPSLKDTSFQDIAVNLECWILFALLIITNCKNWWEASLKTFVFFLISQPLIYLIEVPFVSLGFGIFQYYKYWAVMTVLTIPGAAIAFLVKKKNILSLLVLSVATGYLGYMSVTYGRTAFSDFPRHLLSAIFCFVLAVFFIFVLIDDKKLRIAGIAFICLVMAVTFAISSRNASHVINLPDGEWIYSIDDDSIVSVEIEGDQAKIKAKHDGITDIFFKSTDGKEKAYNITVSGGGIWSSEFEDN